MLERDRDIAMVFQNYALYPHMTVAQNIAFSLKLASGAEGRDQAARAARRRGCSGSRSCSTGGRSSSRGGQRQRVAMGRAIIRQPQAFLMDEPLSNLDAQLRVQMRGEIEALQKRLGVTTVYVTHDQVEAMTMGDRVAVLRAGVLQQVDTPTNVYDRPANLFVAGFIGSPPMNLARGTIERERTAASSCASASATIPLHGEWSRERARDWLGREVIVGMRPEDLEGPRDGRPAAGDDGGQGRPRRGARREPPRLLHRRRAAGDERGRRRGHRRRPRGSALITREGTPFCATFEPRSAIHAGDTVEVTVDVRHLHFFDPETEQAIGT